MGCSHPTAEKCKACNGYGKSTGMSAWPCKVCEGKGKLCKVCGKPA
jgi:hypothetical protein